MGVMTAPTSKHLGRINWVRAKKTLRAEQGTYKGSESHHIRGCSLHNLSLYYASFSFTVAQVASLKSIFKMKNLRFKAVQWLACWMDMNAVGTGTQVLGWQDLPKFQCLLYLVYWLKWASVVSFLFFYFFIFIFIFLSREWNFILFGPWIFGSFC